MIFIGRDVCTYNEPLPLQVNPQINYHIWELVHAAHQTLLAFLKGLCGAGIDPLVLATSIIRTLKRDKLHGQVMHPPLFFLDQPIYAHVRL